MAKKKNIPHHCLCGCGSVVKGTYKRGHWPRPKEEPAIRFWRMVDKSAGADGCWLWTASYNRGGHGQFVVSRGESPRRAHRYAFELEIGPIPPGLFVCHHCDVPACVNPAHLFLGTAKDNTQDAASKRRMSHGEAHVSRRLAPEDVGAILSSSESLAVLSKRFGISKVSVWRIRTGRQWKYFRETYHPDHAEN